MTKSNSKTVIISGAANGIGKYIAQTYANLNFNVIVADIDVPNGVKTAKEIINAGKKAAFFQTDVTNPTDIKNLVKSTLNKFKQINVLINNAGISHSSSIYDLSVEEWDLIINTNLRATFLLTREVAKSMRKIGGGSIVNIASTRAFMSEPGWEAYAASKGGIVALTHAMAASLALDKIRVNCISPGWIETGNYKHLSEADHLQHFSGRVGKPEDISNACVFLTDEKNGFITGTNLIIDGGMTKKMIYL